MISIVLAVSLWFAFAVVFLKRMYRTVPPGFVLIKHSPSQVVTVSRTGAMVLPAIERAELLRVSATPVRVERTGDFGLRFADGARADVVATFTIAVDLQPESIRLVATRVGCERANDEKRLAELFAPRFAGALQHVAAQPPSSVAQSERHVL